MDESLDFDSVRTFPSAGHFVYALIHKGIVMYVGMTTNLVKRLNAHRQRKRREFERCRVAWIEVETREEARELEKRLILKHQPLWNTQDKRVEETRRRKLEDYFGIRKEIWDNVRIN